MKMEKAKEMLEHTGSSIGSISDTLGYEHPRYFIKIFKTLMGMMPAVFRERKGPDAPCDTNTKPQTFAVAFRMRYCLASCHSDPQPPNFTLPLT